LLGIRSQTHLAELALLARGRVPTSGVGPGAVGKQPAQRPVTSRAEAGCLSTAMVIVKLRSGLVAEPFTELWRSR